MDPDHISASTTYVMWREERLWKVGVLKRVHFFNPVFITAPICRAASDCKHRNTRLTEALFKFVHGATDHSKKNCKT
jgi:hypothetical protein